MSTALRTYYRGHTLSTFRDEAAGQSRVYHFDHQGTTQCLTDSTGAVTDRFASDAWGVEVKRTVSSINRQWYVGDAGYYAPPPERMFYVRARFLSPGHGRWSSTDPLLCNLGLSTEPLAPNQYCYAYAGNQPSYFLDPSGLESEEPVEVCKDPRVCCCCPVDVAYMDHTVKEDPFAFKVNPADRRRVVMGRAIYTVSYRLAVKWQVSSTEGGCSLNWFEIGSIPYRNSPKPGRRVDHYDVDTSGMFDPWDKMMERPPCPGARSTVIKDQPSLVKGEVVFNQQGRPTSVKPRTVKFVIDQTIVITGGPCNPPCRPRTRTLKCKITMELVQGMLKKARKGQQVSCK